MTFWESPVDTNDLDVHLFADYHGILGRGDVPPAHVVDVQQSVESAQVDEGAKRGERLHRPAVHVAYRRALVELIALLARFALQPRLPVQDDVHLAAVVELLHEEPRLQTDIRILVTHAHHVDLGERHERAQSGAEVDLVAALDLPRDPAMHRIAGLVGLLQRPPHHLFVGLALGYHHFAVAALLAQQDDVYLVLDVRGCVELIEWYAALRLQTDIHEYRFGTYFNHMTGDQLALFHLVEAGDVLLLQL